MTKSSESENKKPKRIVVKKGDMFKVRLDDDSHCYAHICEKPLTIFYDYNSSNDIELTTIIEQKILFKLWIYNYVPRTENWTRVGNIMSKELDIEPYFYKTDQVLDKLYLHHSEFAETNYERLTSPKEIEGLEEAAVWAENHIENRLRDHYANRPCIWLND